MKLHENSSLALNLKNGALSPAPSNSIETSHESPVGFVLQNIEMILHAITPHRYATEISYWVRSVKLCLCTGYVKTWFLSRRCERAIRASSRMTRPVTKTLVRRMSKRNVCAILCDVVRSRFQSGSSAHHLDTVSPRTCIIQTIDEANGHNEARQVRCRRRA